jgi:hypothetical protein
MKLDTQELQQLLCPEQTAERVDMYAGIHKALRALMADTLLAMGRMDTDDDLERANTCHRLLELLEFCQGHLQHENQFLHTALEARAPGSSAVIGHEHDEHLQEILRLSGLVQSLMNCTERARAAEALGLYRELALFIAHNFEHMHVEETAHNAVLWARYTDAELLQIHAELVASIPPPEMMYTLRWLVPFMNPAERVGLLSDIQAHAPAPAFQGILDTVRPHLTPIEWQKLCKSLRLPCAPGLMEA